MPFEQSQVELSQARFNGAEPELVELSQAEHTRGRHNQAKLSHSKLKQAEIDLLHGLRTPNEGINQRNLKFWANVADKICFPVP